MISIVIPTYNRANTITSTLDSIRNQTCTKWQCLIVDDGSDDNTREVVQKYSDGDARFRYMINERRKGAQGARNTGILAAKGEWVCLFDSDDIMYEDYIEKMYYTLEIEKGLCDVVACYANIRSIQTYQIRGRLDRIQEGRLTKCLLNEQVYVAFDVCVIRKQKLLDIGLLDEFCPSMQEWDTHISLSKICSYSMIPEPLCDWMVGGEDTITRDEKKHVNGLMYIYSKYRSDFRRYAYHHYLNALCSLWPKALRPLSLLRLAPELIVYKPLKQLLKYK